LYVFKFVYYNKLSVIMKAVILSLLVALAVGEQVCLPMVFQFKQTQDWLGFNRRTGGFEMGSNYYDYNNQQYKMVSVNYVGNDQYFTEFVIHAKDKKMWVIQGKKGGGTITCTEHSTNFPPMTPCLLNSAKKVGSWYIAGDVKVDVFSQNGTNGNDAWYQDISIGHHNEAPVVMREVDQNGNSTFTIFYDYTINVSPNEFKKPSLCANSPLIGATKTKKDIAKVMRIARFKNE